jgi:hypothetical protein
MAVGYLELSRRSQHFRDLRLFGLSGHSYSAKRCKSAWYATVRFR